MKALRERQAKGLAEPYKEVWIYEWLNERKWMNGCFIEGLFCSQNIKMSMLQH